MVDKAKRLKIIHVVRDLCESSGGLTNSVVGLVNQLILDGTSEISIFTQHADYSVLTKVDPRITVSVKPAQKLILTFMRLLRSNNKIINREGEIESLDIVHIHGIWHLLGFIVLIEALFRRVPVVIQPHGMLSPAALDWHPKRKYLAWRVFKLFYRSQVKLFIATSETEVTDLQGLGLCRPISCVPNGISLPPKDILDRSQFDKKETARVALYVGRFHPIKGLENLITAWSIVNAEDWVLKIYGYSNSYTDFLQRLCNDLGVKDRISLLGPVTDDNRDQVYHEASIFIMPSLSENFGIGILEALSYGLPVITTKGTPWSNIVEDNIGWYVQPTAEGLCGALTDALNLPSEKLSIMGIHGFRYARRFTWSAVNAVLKRCYDEVLTPYQVHFADGKLNNRRER